MIRTWLALLLFSLPTWAHGPDFPPAALGVFGGARRVGVEGQFSYGLHLGLAAYRMEDAPAKAGARLSLGLGYLPLNLSVLGFSESRSHPQGLGNGGGFRLGTGYNLKRVYVGAYAARLFGQKGTQNEVGLQLAWLPIPF